VGAYFGKRDTMDPDAPRIVLGSDATIPTDDPERELVILVVGETARADRFSLNGYARKTNPELEKVESLVSFRAMQSCATSTAVSVPCMFALPDGDNIDVDAFHHSENLLDVLKHAGVTILWRDNNSDSKGVARDIRFEDFRSPERNPDCDTECRDPDMLTGLGQFVDEAKSGDILIVLHQMGNHGPAYAKRYPPAFEVFTPVCDSNQLEQCSLEAINNSYDNAIRYTDYFLARVIEFLRAYDDRFETALFYISDHGESLGEHDLYLHGLPNLVAPAEQREVASVMWLGKNFRADADKVIAHSAEPLTFSNVFHTVLGMFEVQTAIYRRELDILRNARDGY
jgi:lipid A ethanolaminephosphotransferase